MSLIVKSAPQRGRVVVARAVRDLWDRDPSPAAIGGAAINLSDPLPIYRLGLDEVDATGGLAQAVPVGWRYLLEERGGQAAVADVGEVAGGEARFASLSRGENARRLMDAAALAASIAEATAADYEIRILDVPALHVSAIWLSGGRDIFIPYLDMKRLHGAKIEVADNFLDVLSSRARAMREAHARIEPGPAFNAGS